MKNNRKFPVLFPLVLLVMGIAACDDAADLEKADVNQNPTYFRSVSANGSAGETTDVLILTFSSAISGLNKNDILLSGDAAAGVVKGDLVRVTGRTYHLPVNGIKSSGEITVLVSTRLNVTPKSRKVNVYVGPLPVMGVTLNTDSQMLITNTTGRNDFHILKVARDTENIYFYAETAANITTRTGNNWMRLYIDTDRDFTTGWYGYDYRVINGATLQRYTGSSWASVGAVTSMVEDNKMMITVPRSNLELSSAINMEFKWSDNMQADNPMDWYVNGDAAPGGRFNYIYSAVN